MLPVAVSRVQIAVRANTLPLPPLRAKILVRCVPLASSLLKQLLTMKAIARHAKLAKPQRHRGLLPKQAAQRACWTRIRKPLAAHIAVSVQMAS